MTEPLAEEPQSIDLLERPAKRHRSSPSEDICEQVRAGFGVASSNAFLPNADNDLPPEMWAAVMEYLPFSSVLKCGAVSRTFLRDTMPLVSVLHIERSHEIHVSTASRFRDVKGIYINHLMRRPLKVNRDTALRVVPFLCSFPKLERVFLGNFLRTGIIGFRPRGDMLNEDENCMKSLIDAFSGAFSCGALSQNLWVSGLRCPNSRPQTNLFSPSNCPTCVRACSSFPIQSVIVFECEGSSSPSNNDDGFDYEKIYSLDVCIRRDRLESIVLGRPGGREELYKMTRFYTLLSRGNRVLLEAKDGGFIYAVMYGKKEQEELEIFKRDAPFDVTTLPRQDITTAIMRSFAEDESDPLPPKARCYLTCRAFQFLHDSLKLPIDADDFLNDDEKEVGYFPKTFYGYNWRFH